MPGPPAGAAAGIAPEHNDIEQVILDRPAQAYISNTTELRIARYPRTGSTQSKTAPGEAHMTRLGDVVMKLQPFSVSPRRSGTRTGAGGGRQMKAPTAPLDGWRPPPPVVGSVLTWPVT